MAVFGDFHFISDHFMTAYVFMEGIIVFEDALGFAFWMILVILGGLAFIMADNGGVCRPNQLTRQM